VALIPLLFAYAAYRQRRIASWARYLLIPVVAVVAYQLWTKGLYGRGLFLDAADFASGKRAGAHISLFGGTLVGLSFVGGCMLPAVTLAPLIWSRKQILLTALASAMGAVAILAGWVEIGNRVGGEEAIMSLQQHLLLVGSQLTLCIAGGVCVLALSISDFKTRRDANSLLLLLWVLGTFLFTALLNYAVNARSVLPLLPAAGILLARRFEADQLIPMSQLKRRIAAALAVSGTLASWVTIVDMQLANSARTAVGKIYEKVRESSRKVWFEGHWGFQYYMQSRGALPVDFGHQAISPGDIVVIPENNVYLAKLAPETVARTETIVLRAPMGASTMSWPLGAGLYSSYWGPMPFVFGPVPVEHYTIYQIGTQGEKEGR
jgi:hypothetical protein